MSTGGPNPALRNAAALVFVEELAQPFCSPEDGHHLLDVLRLDDGSTVIAADGTGRYRLCDLSSRPVGPARRGGRRLREAVLGAPGALMEEPAPSPSLTIAFALQKGDRAEWTVQKLTEIGVDLIVPLLSARTVVRLDPDTGRRRGDRLRRVAREAAAQSRRTRLPEVLDPTPLGVFLAARSPGAVEASTVIAEPGGDPVHASTTCVLIGPEGGWSPGEVTGTHGSLGLGGGVLRAETAAVVAGALLAAVRDGTILPSTSD